MLAQVEFASTMLEIGVGFSKASAHVVKDYLSDQVHVGNQDRCE